MVHPTVTSRLFLKNFLEKKVIKRTRPIPIILVSCSLVFTQFSTLDHTFHWAILPKKLSPPPPPTLEGLNLKILAFRVVWRAWKRHSADVHCWCIILWLARHYPMWATSLNLRFKSSYYTHCMVPHRFAMPVFSVFYIREPLPLKCLC